MVVTRVRHEETAAVHRLVDAGEIRYRVIYMFEKFECNTNVDFRQLWDRPFNGAFKKHGRYSGVLTPPKKEILTHGGNVRQRHAHLDSLVAQVFRESSGLLGEATAKIEYRDFPTPVESFDNGIVIEPSGFGIRQHRQGMYMRVYLIGAHHFARAIIRKYLEYIVAIAVEFPERLPCMAVRDRIP